MKIIGFYCDNRPQKEKLKSYSKIGLNICIFTLLILHNPSATAFKLGNVVELIPAIPMGGI